MALLNNKMQRFRDIHLGKRIWVCGSGPSLMDVIVKKIPKDDIIIACNSATYHFKRVHYAVFTDELTQYHNYFLDMKKKVGKMILFNFSIKKIKRNTFYIKKAVTEKFNKDSNESIYGKDVIHCAVNLAWMMGASQIILAGVDLKHKDANNKYAYSNKFNEGTPEDLANILNGAMLSNETLFDGFLGMSLGGWEEINKLNPNLPIINIAVNGNLKIYPLIPFDEIINAT